MKKLTATLAVLVALTPAFPLAAHAHAGHGAKQAEAAKLPLADGVVKKVDKAGGKLTISHDALPNGMPAMTMAFKVKDAAWIEQVKEGQKIRFASENVDGAMTIVRLEVQK